MGHLILTLMSHKILIIDDESEVVELFKGILVSAGFEVLHAYSGDEGYAIAQETRPDLVLLDIQMPKVDGFEVLKKLKENNDLEDIKVIVLSNMQGQEYIDKATDLGADDYWYKMNTHLVDLVEKVKTLLG